jgi:hypothetical protein
LDTPRHGHRFSTNQLGSRKASSPFGPAIRDLQPCSNAKCDCASALLDILEGPAHTQTNS